MKKEVLIAIIIGFSIGLAVTFGVYTAQKSLDNRAKLLKKDPLTTQSLPTPVPSPTLTILLPKENALITTETLTVSGLTVPSSYIAGVSSSDQSTTIADSQGNFSLKLTLKPGPNIITITSYTTEGDKAQTSLEVAFSTTEATSSAKTK